MNSLCALGVLDEKMAAFFWKILIIRSRYRFFSNTELFYNSSFVFFPDIIEKLLEAHELCNPGQYLQKYCSPLDVTLDRGNSL